MFFSLPLPSLPLLSIALQLLVFIFSCCHLTSDRLLCLVLSCPSVPCSGFSFLTSPPDWPLWPGLFSSIATRVASPSAALEQLQFTH